MLVKSLGTLAIHGEFPPKSEGHCVESSCGNLQYPEVYGGRLSLETTIRRLSRDVVAAL